MGVATYTQPNNTTMFGADYQNAIDAATAALRQHIAGFLPHESAPLAMTVTVDSGRIENDSGNLVEIGQQVTPAITAPSGNPRHDLVAIDGNTAVVEVVTGVEAGAPVDPQLPQGKLRVARVVLQTSTTVIDNSIITNLWTSGGGGGVVTALGKYDVQGGFITVPGFSTLYDWYDFHLDCNVNNNDGLLARVSTDGGSTYRLTGYGGESGASPTHLIVAPAAVNAGNTIGKIRLQRPAQTTTWAQFDIEMGFASGPFVSRRHLATFDVAGHGAITHLQFYPELVSLNSGEVQVYGWQLNP